MDPKGSIENPIFERQYLCKGCETVFTEEQKAFLNTVKTYVQELESLVDACLEDCRNKEIIFNHLSDIAWRAELAAVSSEMKETKAILNWINK